MISRVRGEVANKLYTDKGNYLEIYTPGGICYKVQVTDRALSLVGGSQIKNEESYVGEEIELFTYFYVREDAQELYGFASNEEKNIFEKLLDVSGVGGKTAMAVLCQFSVEEIIRMIRDGDSEGLTEVSGLGKKSAQKIILELQDKLDLGQVNELDLSQDAKQSENLGELKSALQGLGFRGAELTDRVDKGKELIKEDEELTFEKLVEEVLKG